MKKYSEINSKPLKELSQDTVNHLLNYDWPGNVRELEHTIERAVILSKEKYITPRDLFLHGITFNDTPPNGQITPATSYEINITKEHDNIKLEAGLTISQMEQELILKTLREVDGNRTKAAELLGITVRTLRNKLNEYREKGVDLTGID
ncbi:hypothetical protein DSN97_05515 [Deferribacteraceae bacterium V6Fe1]|nr:hypothetical protein DSN97_05515 [Deferribacteraceae bacterium V6Fe1]